MTSNQPTCDKPLDQKRAEIRQWYGESAMQIVDKGGEFCVFHLCDAQDCEDRHTVIDP